MASAAQTAFDKQWVSAREIMRRLQISTATLSLAIKREAFPPPDVKVGASLGLWERQNIESKITVWLDRLMVVRRRQSVMPPTVVSANPPWKSTESTLG